MSKISKPVGTSRLVGRNLRLAKLGLRGGGRYAMHRARRTFASVERKDELTTAFQLKTAEDVTAELGNMKGAMMKLGQMASYIDTGLPDHVRQTLASLQHDAPPMAPELAAKQIKDELGSLPEELFLEWDPIPIASASIGQVHRAITREGQAVAVKVQYPGVAEAVKSDLGNAGWLFGAMGSMFPGLDSGPIVDELRDRLFEELDYELEAENQRYYAENYEGHPYIHIPEVIDMYCSGQVLTTELVDGSKFNEVLTWSSEQKNLIAETIFRFSFGAIYGLHAFNGDPHPGNYIFNTGGRVSFLDFGLVKRFTQDEDRLFEDLVVAMVIENDMDLFRSRLESIKMLPVDNDFTNDEIYEYFKYYYNYVLHDRVITIDTAYAEGGVAHIFESGGRFGDLKKSLNVPPSFVVLQRITLGLMGIFAQLDATANFHRIGRELWPFVESEPSTPMGVAIAEWERQRSDV